MHQNGGIAKTRSLVQLVQVNRRMAVSNSNIEQKPFSFVPIAINAAKPNRAAIKIDQLENPFKLFDKVNSLGGEFVPLSQL